MGGGHLVVVVMASCRLCALLEFILPRGPRLRSGCDGGGAEEGSEGRPMARDI
jgi:hypothetical protein